MGLNPERVESVARVMRCNPFRVEKTFVISTQGSSCLATLGWMISILSGLKE
jgi:hypothetical protein